ncbi:uncharacterized protein JN550_012527 [Neoarthrinium moseri]|uniref:uncharacterized protein n=1 Tax=Neoarthrinium moseri TaxID=1658444 RepID=UPI001FDACE9C|nr:uncharacterized protein JN550_012527 [Neoarthrinium moseri]KAI1858695.1 hypothetical protein JN550_012527 [Neoarthrinium moseri]
MGQSKITLYVDVVSPFAYEAFHILQNEPVFKDVQVKYVPIFLGGLMKACGNTPPINIKNKDKWIQTEKLRWARAFDVPMAAASPANFPPMTLALMRALAALSAHQEGGGQRLLAAALAKLWHALWVEHAEVEKPAVFGPLLAAVLGRERAEEGESDLLRLFHFISVHVSTLLLMAEASTSGKTALKDNTDRAFEDGAFGLPWMVATNGAGQTEGFWGVDHMAQVLQFLGLEKPGQGGWRSVL